MTTDCFDNPTPGVPPSISDTFAAIRRYATIPWSQRDDYHRARVDAMIGHGSHADAWDKLREMNLAIQEDNK